ncbi:MAG: serine/threonine-protein phosphatase [Clostridium sp.]|nr:serine/threonine-protein phosphatase [Clostridium sp.]MCM1207304.1 serine/threonine-protein phosphatase [Ruminococcus sp.]
MFNVVGFTDKGLYREKNEDCILINKTTSQGGKIEGRFEDSFIVGIADGVGGRPAGEVASKIILEKISTIDLQKDAPELLLLKVEEASDCIRAIEKENIQMKGMASTLTLLVVSDTKIYTINVGNSRIYKLKNGFLIQMTEDDTLIKDYSYENVFDNLRNIITKSINANYEDGLSQKKYDRPIDSSEFYILTSDGVHDYISIDDLELILNDNITLEEKVTQISDKILGIKNHDNYSMVLVEKL